MRNLTVKALTRGSHRVPGPPPDHGQYIYAYCHTRTNQVLYSLSRHLQGARALKQLADAGANNNPAKVRKDLWQALWTVALPPTSEGRSQGLNLYARLREWRRVHETSWTPPEFFHRLYTPAEMEEMQKRLDQRGGSKKESVHSLIKREKRKIRARMVMDQKANSIADLAAALQEQVQIGAEARRKMPAFETSHPPQQSAETLEEQAQSGAEATPELEARATDSSQSPEQAMDTVKEDAELETQASDPSRLQKAFSSTYTAEGVRVMWKNPLDAEFARQWPAEVEHTPMGLSRHEAPDPRVEPVLDVATYRERASRLLAKMRKVREVRWAEAKTLVFPWRAVQPQGAVRKQLQEMLLEEKSRPRPRKWQELKHAGPRTSGQKPRQRRHNLQR